jgi:hypothetical protein
MVDPSEHATDQRRHESTGCQRCSPDRKRTRSRLHGVGAGGDHRDRGREQRRSADAGNDLTGQQQTGAVVLRREKGQQTA